MRKTIIYMDLLSVEYGESFSPIEQETRERLCTRQNWDCFIFWMDIKFSLELLSDYERRCFVANLIEGYTEEEIGHKFKVSHKAISLQIKKARRKIKRFLKKGGYKTP